MNTTELNLGDWVETTVDWPAVNITKGTKAMLVDDDGSTQMFAWETEEKPVPDDLTPQEIGKLGLLIPNVRLAMDLAMRMPRSI
jgi:hypothetical protein